MLKENENEMIMETKEAQNEALDAPKDTDAQVNAQNKTFTKAEVDEIVKKRLARAFKDYPDKEEMARLINLKDDLETKDKEISSLKDAASLNTQRLATYELKDKILKRGVDLKYADFALFEIERGIKEGLDFDSSFESFAQNNDFLFKKIGTTGLRQGGAIYNQSSIEDSFYKINPRLKKGGF